MVRQYHIGGSSCRRIDVFNYGGETRTADKRENVRGVCTAERPLRLRLRSTELVHDVYLRERPVDRGTILALLPAERLMPRPTLLRNRPVGAHWPPEA
jgi:hypothetical protein